MQANQRTFSWHEEKQSEAIRPSDKQSWPSNLPPKTLSLHFALACGGPHLSWPPASSATRNRQTREGDKERKESFKKGAAIQEAEAQQETSSVSLLENLEKQHALHHTHIHTHKLE